MTQSKTKIIGLTGGISTGKSTASRVIRDKGFKVIDADVIAREVLEVDQDAYVEVVECFGHEILNKDKSINRSFLGDKIFKDKTLRNELNSITHPYIMSVIKKNINDNYKEETLFLDIPLLIEVYDLLVDSEIFIDEIWLIYCDREEQIKRLMKRDRLSYDNAELKVKAQMDIEDKKKFVDKVIDNTKGRKDLIENIEHALE